jgi:hypothetical protein
MPEYRWAQGSIAGVELDVSGDPVKCVILDGFRLQSQRFVNQRFAAGGQVYTQGFDNEGRGARFGVRLDNVPVDMLQSIIAAVNTALDTNDTFTVELTDDFHTVDASCVVDGSEWITYPDQLTNESFFAQVVMRFITQ